MNSNKVSPDLGHTAIDDLLCLTFTGRNGKSESNLWTGSHRCESFERGGTVNNAAVLLVVIPTVLPVILENMFCYCQL